MMDINGHQDQTYTRGDNNGRDLYFLRVNVLVLFGNATKKILKDEEFECYIFSEKKIAFSNNVLQSRKEGLEYGAFV